MRRNRESGEHGTENMSSCSGPNGDPMNQRVRLNLDAPVVVVERLDRIKALLGAKSRSEVVV